MKRKTTTPESECKRILLELGFPAHHCGYRQLKCAIPQFALDDQQSLLTELYPYIVNELRCSEVAAVERAIGRCIEYTWAHGNRKAWEKYFPSCTEAPSAKRFIATIAEYLK